MSIYDDTRTLLTNVDRALKPGEEFPLGSGLTLAHYPIQDTALAACLATLDVPLREPGPFTDDVALDERGNEAGRTVAWWLAGASQSQVIEDARGPRALTTEDVHVAWRDRPAWERAHPLHPLNHMRAALDARLAWLGILSDGGLPREHRGPGAVFITPKISAASILQACGFRPLACGGAPDRRTFHLEAAHGGLSAEQILATAARAEGATPPQWMSRVLLNLAAMLRVSKNHAVIIRQTHGDQTLFLTADSTPKTRDKFHGLL